ASFAILASFLAVTPAVVRAEDDHAVANKLERDTKKAQKEAEKAAKKAKKDAEKAQKEAEKAAKKAKKDAERQAKEMKKNLS
ncbi:MAG TPA: hypothetical protein VL404_00945, partial [Candidatus Eisenbacteria bacterium]|nr:hypothetical protein [Candidatus Eisenbacteria bacterium]